MALAVTWRGDASARFRSIVVLAAAAVATLVCCAAVSAGLMTQRVDDRSSERSLASAGVGQPADFGRGAIYDSVRGDQIFVFLWRIETPGATIPGVPADAAEGDWFVSPALQRRIAVDRQLDGRFSDARLIGEEGVGPADELLAFRLVGPEFELDERLVAVPGSEYIGQEPSTSVVSIALAGAGFVLIVGVGFLSAALGPVGVGLERRLILLSALGATRSPLWMLTAVSTVIVAAPGAFVVGAAWYVVSPELQAVPVVGERAFAGDLAIPAWLAAVVALGVVILAAVLSARRTPRHVGSRPTARILKAPAVWRVVPLFASLGLIIYSTTLSTTAPDSKAIQHLVTGIVASALSITFALPVLVDRLGAVIASGRSFLALLIGRRLRWNAATSSRPLMALAALAVVVPAAASFIVVQGAPDSPPSESKSTVAVIGFSGADDFETFKQIEKDAGGVFAETYISPRNGNLQQIRTWVIQCDQLAAYVQFDRCGPEGIDVGPLDAGAFAVFDAGSTVPPEGHELGGTVLITDDEDRAEAVLRAYVVNHEHLGPFVSSPGNQSSEGHPGDAWIFAGYRLAAVGAFAALLLSVATAASENAGTRLRLTGLGAELSVIRRLVAVESAATVAIVGLSGVAVGTVGAIAYAAVDGRLSPNYWPSTVLAASTLIAAALSGLAAAFVITVVKPRTALRALD